MSQISFDQIQTSNNDNNSSNIGFFSLKNDGDEAIVRIMHDDINSFDLITTHPIKLGERYRRVNCIRDPRDPIDNCPMCKTGAKVEQRMYIHLIQYVRDENGAIIPQGKIWERSAAYAMTIKALIDEYGPLSDCIFKIRRSGAKGSRDTTYSILFGNPNVYKTDLYPKDETIFEGYKSLGRMVLNKNFDELSEFLATGEFPKKQDKVADESQYVVPQDVPFTINQSNAPVAQPAQTFVRDTMVNPNTHFVDSNNVTAPQRPVRYY